jgi:energy-coupling factor transporter ATP-binding protein EcfA2
MKLTKIKIEEFKRLRDLELPIEEVNLLIGGNNSGKSSVLQALHFAVTCLRSARQYGKGSRQPATTLGVNQFSFLPTTEIMSIRHRTPMTQSSGPKFTFSFEDESGLARQYKLALTRGKNANVALKFQSNTPFFKQASDLRRPFSIYVPGLAGLSLLEERRANSVVTSGIAQGDANLYLRNLLLRIHESPEKRTRLNTILGSIFPDTDITTKFDEDTTQHISAYISLQKMRSPLELAGTGALQALQLAAYVVLYEPKLLLLDEPDAHLHPGNQKQLVDLIFEIANNTDTAVIMASHSRHVLDRVEANTLGTVTWLREGKIQSTENADLPLLLDIGALDTFEEISKPHVKNLLFTEDGLTNKLKLLLEASGINLNHVQIIPFNGADNLSACQTVVDFFLSLGKDRRAVIYRDGDGLTENEKNWLRAKAARVLPANTTYLIGSLTDIEHYFCRPAHIASIYGISGEEAQSAVDAVILKNQAWLSAKLVKKRSDIKNKSLRGCDVWTSTDDLTGNGIEFEFAYGKALVGKILNELKGRRLPTRDLYSHSDNLCHDDFTGLFPD